MGIHLSSSANGTTQFQNTDRKHAAPNEQGAAHKRFGAIVILKYSLIVLCILVVIVGVLPGSSKAVWKIKNPTTGLSSEIEASKKYGYFTLSSPAHLGGPSSSIPM